MLSDDWTYERRDQWTWGWRHKSGCYVWPDMYTPYWRARDATGKDMMGRYGVLKFEKLGAATSYVEKHLWEQSQCLSATTQNREIEPDTQPSQKERVD